MPKEARTRKKKPSSTELIGPKKGDLRVWHIPQVPGKAFRWPVKTVEEGKLLLRALAEYDTFQLEHRIKGEYCNANGLEEFEPELCADGEDGWTEWNSPDGEEIWDLIKNDIDLAKVREVQES